MKNIHVLPTDKNPIKGDLLLRHLWRGTSNECISWWRYNETITIDDVIQYTTLNSSFRDITSSFKTHNIYITSDEEIKEGDWFIDLRDINTEGGLYDEDIYCAGSGGSDEFANKIGKKIILTTDQDLIKDGVQAIEDEFLEWFVKNPSCEKVKVEKYHGIKTSIAEISAVSGNDDYDWQGIGDNRDYRIIIPKEEELFERANKMSDEELLTFGKSCFYKGFEKAKKDDANCYTAFREEIGSLILKFKNK